MKKRIFAALLVLMLILPSCAPSAELPDSPDKGNSQGGNPPSSMGNDSANSPANVEDESASTPPVEIVIGTDEMFTSRDKKTAYDAGKSTVIDLSKATSGTVKITKEGTYVVRGTLNGMIIVDASGTDKIHIILDGASVYSSSSAALYVKSADKVVLTLADGSHNTLESGEKFVRIDDSNIDSAVFSRDDLTINGTGSLTVNSPSGHGIVCKDDLVFTGGNITVNSASHGIDANDSVRIASACITIDSGKDGVHVENTDDATLGFFYMESGEIAIECEGDGIDAGSYVNVLGGSIDILAGGGYENGDKKSSSGFGGFMGGGWGGNPGRGDRGSTSDTSTDEASSSMKGIKAELISIHGGVFSIDSADDAIHSNTDMTLYGGEYDISTGDDAIHAEENLTVSGGRITVQTSYEGLEAHHITVSGGEITLTATDDGLNAAGGVDSSGSGGRDGMFGGGGRPGGGGGFGGGSSDGSITITGGVLYINSSGDGMDANGTLLITGGHTTIVGPTQGDTATLDYDVSGTITGGTFIGTGSTMMAQTFSSSENQGVIAINAGSCRAGTKITLKDSAGNIVIERTPELDFAVIILSSPDIKKGEGYTIYVGNNYGTFTAQ